MLDESAVICVIAKNEELYIHEWIQYHLKLGFDHIYIYDNDERFPLKPLECMYPAKVTVIYYPGRCLQLRSYYAFVYNYCYQHTWAAFIDVDEFIVLKKHDTIKDLLREKCTSGALVLNWVLFGSNGHENYEKRPVLERFTKREKGVNIHTKWIVKLIDLDNMITPHFGKLLHGKALDPNGVEVTESLHYHGTDEVAAIYHYFTKSKQEFLYKCIRGRADIPEMREFIRDFEVHDKNEIEDTTALDFLRR